MEEGQVKRGQGSRPVRVPSGELLPNGFGRRCVPGQLRDRALFDRNRCTMTT
jgi:hypothetical protein